MPIQIYNSLSRKKELLEPLEPPSINIYTCGVTVYDDCHIGHARSLYIFDVIRRYLAYRGHKVNFVRNITDIDDKIINRANELNTDWGELVRRYIERYYEDMDILGIAKADFEPRATDNIPAMIEYIRNLIEKGYAYTTGTGVYYSVRKFSGYGKLSGQGIEQMLAGVRKESDETKEDPLDFALWKASKEGEPFWDSPWGKGRPGWHIECSVMSQKFLKTDTLDIHAGGRDLIFPHHENELAQAEALTGKPFAKYWIHHGLLTINGQKMSKSLGNFVSIRDFISKYSYPVLLKLFFLSAHYAHPIDYTEERIEEAKAELETILNLLRKREMITANRSLPSAAHSNKEVAEIKENFLKAMDDDFNTPKALAAVFDLVHIANKKIDDSVFIVDAKFLLNELLEVLGIREISVVVLPETLSLAAKVLEVKVADGVTVQEDVAVKVVDEDIIKKIQDREKARKNKDFQLADRIRKELEARGVIVEDSKDGPTWRRKL